MKTIGQLLGTNLKRPKEKIPPHELSATVELIQKAGLFTKKYGWGYWLGKVKRAQVKYSEMVGIIKEIQAMDPKYSKGGRLTNLLTAKYKALKEKQHGKEIEGCKG